MFILHDYFSLTANINKIEEFNKSIPQKRDSSYLNPPNHNLDDKEKNVKISSHN